MPKEYRIPVVVPRPGTPEQIAQRLDLGSRSDLLRVDEMHYNPLDGVVSMLVTDPETQARIPVQLRHYSVCRHCHRARDGRIAEHDRCGQAELMSSAVISTSGTRVTWVEGHEAIFAMVETWAELVGGRPHGV